MSVMFATRVRDRTLTLGTRLCLGLDPRADAYSGIAHLRAHTLEVLTACAELAGCAKPQLAFYEALGIAGSRSWRRSARGRGPSASRWSSTRASVLAARQLRDALNAAVSQA
jgi:hypothetical protein